MKKKKEIFSKELTNLFAEITFTKLQIGELVYKLKLMFKQLAEQTAKFKIIKSKLNK